MNFEVISIYIKNLLTNQKKKNKQLIEYHTRCGLMIGVLVLHLEKSDSNDNPNKTLVVHVLLPITVTWRRVNEPIITYHLGFVVKLL